MLRRIGHSSTTSGPGGYLRTRTKQIAWSTWHLFIVPTATSCKFWSQARRLTRSVGWTFRRWSRGSVCSWTLTSLWGIAAGISWWKRCELRSGGRDCTLTPRSVHGAALRAKESGRPVRLLSLHETSTRARLRSKVGASMQQDHSRRMRMVTNICSWRSTRSVSGLRLFRRRHFIVGAPQIFCILVS